MTPEHMTILTVDDTPANIRLLTHYLHKQGYKVITAEDGFEGFKAAINYRPDLILLDVMMPGTDGYEVCELLKTEEETRDIPVVFLTAKAEVEDRIRGFEMGAVDYITKPFNLTEIATRVKTQLQLRYLYYQNKRLFNILKDSASHLSLGILSEELFLRINDDVQTKLNNEDSPMDSQIKAILNDITKTGKLVEKYQSTLGKIAAGAQKQPLYQLLDDAVDLVRHKHRGPLSVDCEQPGTDIMVNVHAGLAMHALAELMSYAANRMLSLDVLEINALGDESKEVTNAYQQVSIIAKGEINGEIPDTEQTNILEDIDDSIPGYALAAAVTAVRCLGGRVVSEIYEQKNLKIAISLPA